MCNVGGSPLCMVGGGGGGPRVQRGGFPLVHRRGVPVCKVGGGFPRVQRWGGGGSGGGGATFLSLVALCIGLEKRLAVSHAVAVTLTCLVLLTAPDRSRAAAAVIRSLMGILAQRQC